MTEETCEKKTPDEVSHTKPYAKKQKNKRKTRRKTQAYTKTRETNSSRKAKEPAEETPTKQQQILKKGRRDKREEEKPN